MGKLLTFLLVGGFGAGFRNLTETPRIERMLCGRLSVTLLIGGFAQCFAT